MTAVARYRVAARIVGIALIVLVVVAMPLQFAAGDARLVHILGPVHGLLYLVYLGTVLDLGRRVRVSGWQLAAMVGAGLIPFLTFVVEHRITADVSEKSQVHASH